MLITSSHFTTLRFSVGVMTFGHSVSRVRGIRWFNTAYWGHALQVQCCIKRQRSGSLQTTCSRAAAPTPGVLLVPLTLTMHSSRCPCWRGSTTNRDVDRLLATSNLPRPRRPATVTLRTNVNCSPAHTATVCRRRIAAIASQQLTNVERTLRSADFSPEKFNVISDCLRPVIRNDGRQLCRKIPTLSP